MRSSETLFALLTKKTDIAAAVAAIGRYPVTAIAETLDVVRSNLIERVPKKRLKRTSYNKMEDVRLLPMIRELVDPRLTYGYRRITALLNRQLAAAGEPRINHKRIHRIMELYGWLLERYTGRRIQHAYHGLRGIICRCFVPAISVSNALIYA